jgi:3-(3-hydroxy-phenyl)propionate hydroxylase
VLPECPLTVVRDGAETVQHMTDLLGPGFTIFQFCASDADDGALAGVPAALKAQGITATLVKLTPRRAADATAPYGWDHSGRLFALYGAEAGGVYLVRPDGHVAGRWQAPAAATLLTAIDRVLHPQAR